LRCGTAGLDAVEAAAHPERYGSNADVVAKHASVAGALQRRLLETLSLILLVAGIVLAARSSW
jgi:Mg2+-importing ATPase